MPYRVKITSPHWPEPYYWPGRGLEPIDMSKDEALAVIERRKPFERTLARWAAERGEAHQPCLFELDWVRGERQLPRRMARR